VKSRSRSSSDQGGFHSTLCRYFVLNCLHAEPDSAAAPDPGLLVDARFDHFHEWTVIIPARPLAENQVVALVSVSWLGTRDELLALQFCCSANDGQFVLQTASKGIITSFQKAIDRTER
jgi:hypothetical protein